MNKAKRLIASICAVCLLGTSLIPFAYEAPQAKSVRAQGQHGAGSYAAAQCR